MKWHSPAFVKTTGALLREALARCNSPGAYADSLVSVHSLVPSVSYYSLGKKGRRTNWLKLMTKLRTGYLVRKCSDTINVQPGKAYTLIFFVIIFGILRYK